MVACWTTSLVPITLMFDPTLTLAAAPFAEANLVPAVAGVVATLGCRLCAAMPERLKGVDELVAWAGRAHAPRARIGMPLAAAVTRRSLRTITPPLSAIEQPA
ncbi:MAG TPA: hypothetical protein VIO16_09140 [Dehalococcoidia bacterium]|jgi:hypothetical protein